MLRAFLNGELATLGLRSLSVRPLTSSGRSRACDMQEDMWGIFGSSRHSQSLAVVVFKMLDVRVELNIAGNASMFSKLVPVVTL
jgi:hypothetical protein